MAESHDQEAIYKEFEVTLRRQRLILAVMAVGVLIVILWIRVPGLGLLPILGGGIGTMLLNSCPACEQFLGRGSVVYCPKCGVRLRRPE